MEKKTEPKTGLARIWAAFFYTLKGLRHAYGHEAAFREECILAGILLPILIFLPLSLPWKGLLLSTMALVLVTELLNSAIEAVVDLVSPDFHPLAGQAKDMGSAAVFISLMLAGVVWVLAIASLVIP